MIYRSHGILRGDVGPQFALGRAVGRASDSGRTPKRARLYALAGIRDAYNPSALVA